MAVSFEKYIKDVTIEKIAKEHGISKKQAKEYFLDALSSILVQEEIMNQVKFFVEENNN